MKTDFFITVTNLTTNDGSTMGPYINRQECKEFMAHHNSTIFKQPKIIFMSDDIIVYEENTLKIKYEIFVKNVT